MKSEKIIEALGNIDDRLVLDVFPAQPHRKKRRWPTWVMAAAMITLCVFGANYLGLFSAPQAGRNQPGLSELATENAAVTESVFHMLRPASTALIAYACWETLKSTLLQLPAASFESMFCWQNIAIFAIVWILYDRFHGHPIFYIIGCAALGILFQL